LTQNKEILANLCWPFHEAVLNHIEPKVILCFGRTVGNFVKTKLSANTLVGEFVERNKRKWTSRAFNNDNGVTVVIATHPSIADWTNPDTDPTCLIKAFLQKLV
jgi:uracil-DNA glycosylase